MCCGVVLETLWYYLTLLTDAMCADRDSDYIAHLPRETWWHCITTVDFRGNVLGREYWLRRHLFHLPIPLNWKHFEEMLGAFIQRGWKQDPGSTFLWTLFRRQGREVFNHTSRSWTQTVACLRLEKPWQQLKNSWEPTRSQLALFDFALSSFDFPACLRATFPYLGKCKAPDKITTTSGSLGPIRFQQLFTQLRAGLLNQMLTRGEERRGAGTCGSVVRDRIVVNSGIWASCTVCLPVTMEAGQLMSKTLPLKINLHEGRERRREKGSGGREEEGKEPFSGDRRERVSVSME